jgi:hypothetical protein
MTVILPKDKRLKNKRTTGDKNNPDRDGKKGDGKKGNGLGSGMGKFYGGRGGYKGVRVKGVRRLVNGVLKDELNDLRKQARASRQDGRYLAQAAKRDYRRGLGDLNYVHGETADYLSGLNQRTQQTYADQGNQQAQAQAALNSMLGSTYSGAQSGASEELARLGIQGGGNFQQLGADQANAQAVAAQSGANAQSTLGMAGANSAAGMQMLQGMNQGSFMQGVGQNLNARNDQLGQIRSDRVNQMNEIRRAMQEARGSRRDMFFQLLQQLQQTGWDQYVQQQQLGMQRREQRHRLRKD